MTAPPTQTTTQSPFPTSPTGVTTRRPTTTTRRPTTTRYYDPVSQEHQEGGGVDQPSQTYQELPQHRGVTVDFGVTTTLSPERRARNTRATRDDIRDVLVELDEASIDLSNRSTDLSILEDYKAKHGGIPAPVEHVELTQEQKDDAFRRFGTYSYDQRGSPDEAGAPPSVTDTSGRRGSGQSGRGRGSAKGQTYFSVDKEKVGSFLLERVRTLRDALVSPFGSLKHFEEVKADRGDDYTEQDYAADFLQESLGKVESLGIGDAAKTPTFNPEAGAVELREQLLATQKRLAINKRIAEDPTVHTRVDVAPITKEEIEAQEDAALEAWGLHPSQHQVEGLPPDEHGDPDGSVKDAAAQFVQEFYENQPGLVRRAAELVPIAGTLAYGIGPGGRPIGQTLARAALFDLPSVLALGRFPAYRRSGQSLLKTAGEVGLDVYAVNPRDFGQIVGGSGRDFARAIGDELGGIPRTASGINPISDYYFGSSIATSGGTNKIDLIDLQKLGLDDRPGPRGQPSEADRVSQEAKEKFAAAHTEVGAGSTKIEVVTDSGEILEFEAYTTLPGSHTGPDLSWLTNPDQAARPIGSSAAQPYVVDVKKAVEEAVASGRTEVRQLADQLDEARANLSEHLDDLRPLQEEQALRAQANAQSGAWKTGERPAPVEGLPDKTEEALEAIARVGRAEQALQEAVLLGDYARLNVGEEGAMFFGTGVHENYLRSSALGLGGGAEDLATVGGAATYGLRSGFQPSIKVVAEKVPAGVLIGPRAAGEGGETVIGDPTVRVPYKNTRELEHIQRTSELNVEGGGGKVPRSQIADTAADSPYAIKKAGVVGRGHSRGVDINLLGVEEITPGQRLQLKARGLVRAAEAFVNPGQYTGVNVRKIGKVSDDPGMPGDPGDLPGGGRRGGRGPDDPGPGKGPDDPGTPSDPGDLPDGGRRGGRGPDDPGPAKGQDDPGTPSDPGDLPDGGRRGGRGPDDPGTPSDPGDLPDGGGARGAGRGTDDGGRGATRGDADDAPGARGDEDAEGLYGRDADRPDPNPLSVTGPGRQALDRREGAARPTQPDTEDVPGRGRGDGDAEGARAGARDEPFDILDGDVPGRGRGDGDAEGARAGARDEPFDILDGDVPGRGRGDGDAEGARAGARDEPFDILGGDVPGRGRGDGDAEGARAGARDEPYDILGGDVPGRGRGDGDAEGARAGARDEPYDILGGDVPGRGRGEDPDGARAGARDEPYDILGGDVPGRGRGEDPDGARTGRGRGETDYPDAIYLDPHRRPVSERRGTPRGDGPPRGDDTTTTEGPGDRPPRGDDEPPRGDDTTTTTTTTTARPGDRPPPVVDEPPEATTTTTTARPGDRPPPVVDEPPEATTTTTTARPGRPPPPVVDEPPEATTTTTTARPGRPPPPVVDEPPEATTTTTTARPGRPPPPVVVEPPEATTTTTTAGPGRPPPPVVDEPPEATTTTTTAGPGRPPPPVVDEPPEATTTTTTAGPIRVDELESRRLVRDEYERPRPEYIEAERAIARAEAAPRTRPPLPDRRARADYLEEPLPREREPQRDERPREPLRARQEDAPRDRVVREEEARPRPDYESTRAVAEDRPEEPRRDEYEDGRLRAPSDYLDAPRLEEVVRDEEPRRDEYEEGPRLRAPSDYLEPPRVEEVVRDEEPRRDEYEEGPRLRAPSDYLEPPRVEAVVREEEPRRGEYEEAGPRLRARPEYTAPPRVVVDTRRPVESRREADQGRDARREDVREDLRARPDRPGREEYRGDGRRPEEDAPGKPRPRPGTDTPDDDEPRRSRKGRFPQVVAWTHGTSKYRLDLHSGAMNVEQTEIPGRAKDTFEVVDWSDRRPPRRKVKVAGTEFVVGAQGLEPSQRRRREPMGRTRAGSF